MSFCVSVSGSDQPYALRNTAIAASKLLTPRTTCSMPLTGAPCTLADVWTRQARGVWSSMMKGSVEPGVPEPTSAVIHSIDIPSGRLRLPRWGAVTGMPAFFSRSTSCSKTFVPTAQAQVTASSDINFAQSEPAAAPGFTGAISSMYDASSKPRRAIWVMPLLCGPPRSGVKPTSVKVWRSVSRFDPQTDTWSSSRVTVLFSWVVAVWGRAGDEYENERCKGHAGADRGTPLGHACLLRKKKEEWYARKRDQGTISCEREPV